MIDTHSHIYEPEFDGDRVEAVQRAQQAGVEKLLLPNINAESLPRMLGMCRQHPGVCYPMFGLHPEDVKDDWKEIIDTMQGTAPFDKNPYIAIGEVGLDFYWDDTYRHQQIEAFEYQICMAIQYDLPLVIHSRKAEPELLQAMQRHRNDNLRGIFHCFSGSMESAQQLLRYSGFVLGIGGVLTFRKSKLPQTLKGAVPLDRIVLETDDPYLAPTPHRGERNEPAFMVHVCDMLAEIYETEPQNIENITTDTVKRIFSAIR